MKNAKPLDGVLIASDLDGTVTKQDTIFEFIKQFGVMEEAMRLDEKNLARMFALFLDKLTRKNQFPFKSLKKLRTKQGVFLRR